MSELRVDAAGFRPVTWPTAPALGSAEAPGFGETLSRAVQGVVQAQGEAQEAVVALASGQPVDMARTLVTIEQANISLQFALQVRNKLLEAYQEIMRMPV
jgi:flagellar hook-basal body complex protein FliE